MFRWILLLLVVVAVAAGLAVGALNPDSVTLDLAVARIALPLGALVLCALAVGTVCGLVLAWLLFVIPGKLKAPRRRRADKESALPADPNA